MSTDRVLRLPIQYYQLGRMYGPGMPQSGTEGLHVKILEKPVSQVGIVSVHCWNLGEATGPYPIGPNAHCPGEAADWVPTAHEIDRNCIRPVFDAARRVGVRIFHLGTPTYAPRYPTYEAIAEDPELQAPPPQASVPGCIRPGGEDIERDVLGPSFPGSPWKTCPEIFDIAKPVRPLPDEPVFLDGYQLNGLCRRYDIDTLIYVGYMANICLMHVPGALREMGGEFGYRCIALRDCTVAYECPDTYQGNWMTRAAIRMIEQGLGYSSSSQEFIAACNEVGAGQ